MQFITPIFLIIVAVAVFFGFVDPQYKDIAKAKALESQYEEALSRSKELQEIREELLSEYNTFKADDVSRLEKLLPDNIDNVRLIIEIDAIAKKYGLSVRNLAVTESVGNDSGTLVAGNSDYSSVDLSFSVASSYEDFLSFIKDLEQSLRLVDVTSINFVATGSKVDDYRVTIRTYWLK